MSSHERTDDLIRSRGKLNSVVIRIQHYVADTVTSSRKELTLVYDETARLSLKYSLYSFQAINPKK